MQHNKLGNEYFQKQEYKTAIKHYTRSIHENENETLTRNAFGNRSASYLHLAHQSHPISKDLCLNSISDAKKSIEIDKNWAKGYGRLGSAYFANGDFQSAVKAYKLGLSLDSSNIVLKEGLKRARIGVVNNMLAEPAVSLKKKDAKKDTCTAVAESLCTHTNAAALSMQRLGQLMLYYTMEEMGKVDGVKTALYIFGFGIVCHAIHHILKLCLVVILGMTAVYLDGIGKISLQRYMKELIRPMDKVKSIFLLPSTMYCIPILMGVYGQVKMFKFVHGDIFMSCSMLVITVYVTAYDILAKRHHKHRLKRLKLSAHFAVFMYWVIYKQYHRDFFKVLAPFSIHTAGMMLEMIPSTALHGAFRRGLSKGIHKASAEVTEELGLDAWMVLGLGQWAVNYWQQPATFTMTELASMISSSVESIQQGLTETFHPEIEHFRSKCSHLQDHEDYDLLVQYIKLTVNDMPPNKIMAYIVLVLKRCPSIVAALYLLGVSNLFVWSIVPFMLAEVEQLLVTIDLLMKDEFKECDSIQLILFDSPLLHVWVNVRSAVYCMECSVTMTKAVATGSSALQVAAKLSRYFGLAYQIHREGIHSNASNLGDCLSETGSLLQDSRTMISNLCDLSSDEQYQSIHQRIVNWWYASPTNQKLS